MAFPGGRWVAAILCPTMLITGASCASLGPKSVVRDRTNYTDSLSDSWKRQMLANLVKMRYGDAPIFLEISSIIASYEISGTASITGGTFIDPEGTGAHGTISGTYANRPTITYNPLSGDKFARSLMTPIPIAAILNILQAGYAADLALRLCVQSINGLQNRNGSRMRPGDPEFFKLIEKMRKIQDAGAVGMRVKTKDKQQATVFVFRGNTDAATRADIADVRKTLGLAPGAREIQVTYGLLPERPGEIAILSRSVLQIISDIASYIEVPENDVSKGIVNATLGSGDSSQPPPMLNIRSGPSKPSGVFTAIPYRNQWFWIDDTDYRSKRMFSFLMFVFTLVQTGDKGDEPIVTVPAR